VYLLTFSLRHSIREALILGFSLCCIAAYGFLINDLWDLPVDRNNKAGRLENVPKDVLRLATFGSAFFLSLGLVLISMLQFHSFFAMVIIAAGLTVYTFWIRPKLYLANLLAAFLASTPLWLPNIVFMEPPKITQILIVVVAVLILLGREVIFDIADHFGDAQMKRRTIPVVFGDQIARRIAVAMQLSGCGLLMGLIVLQAGQFSFALRLLLYITFAVFAILVISINLKLLVQAREVSLKRIFAKRTRFAMLLLPILLFLLLSK
jgi:4-hydroxybenzoate polyprenyltransferase